MESSGRCKAASGGRKRSGRRLAALAPFHNLRVSKAGRAPLLPGETHGSPAQGEKLMKKLVALAAALLIPCTAGAAPREKEEKKVPPVLNFTMKSLDGKPIDLSQFQ